MPDPLGQSEQTSGSGQRSFGGRSAVGPWVAAGFVAAVGAVAVLIPMIHAVGGAWWGAAGESAAGSSPGGFGGGGVAPWSGRAVWIVSLVVPILIGLLSTAMAWPLARVLSRTGSAPGARVWWVLVACVPMVLPMSVGYAGWSTLRTPAWLSGRMLENLGGRASEWAGYLIGVGSLVVWLVPMCAVVLSLSLARLSREHEDLLALETARGVRGAAHRLRVRLGVCRGGLASSFMLAVLLALSSAVPIHLANIPTIAIDLWAELSARPAAEVWRRATPLVLAMVCIGLAIAIWGGGRLGRERPEEANFIATRGRPRDVGLSLRTRLLAMLPMVLGVVVPMAIMAVTLREARSLWRFWIDTSPALGASLSVSAMVGAVLVLLCVATFYGLSAAGRGGVDGGGGRSAIRAVVWVMLGVMLAGALVPGVLIGSAWAGLATALRGLDQDVGLRGVLAGASDGPMILIAAHVARFGVVGVLAGIALWRSEEQSLRQARVLMAGDGLRAFGVLVLATPTRLAVLAGVAIVGAALSLHEIESAIMVQPPGRASLARQLLEQLHYLQDERTSASIINLGALGLLMAAGVAWCAARLRRDDAR